MSGFLHQLNLAAPFFALVFIGYGLMRFSGWPKAMSENLSRFVFSVAMPAMLFHMMSDLSRLPPVDVRLLIAFFGSCVIVFAIGRVVSWKLFGLDGQAQSIFAMGGVFSNNVFLGIPLAKVALVLVFNWLILWTLVTINIEWARHGSFSVKGFAKTLRGLLTNPIVASILSGSLFGVSGLAVPDLIDRPLAMVGQAAAQMAMIVLGMGLAEYGVREGWRISVGISAMKLVVQPAIVWLLARALGLPPMETQVVVMLASLAVGANVYLMARQFRLIEGPVAGSLILSTALSSVTTPLTLALMGATPP